MGVTCRAVVMGLAIALALSGCVRTAMRDIDMGANRYLVTVSGDGFADLADVEKLFQVRARDVATQHGFDSYRVSEFSSRFEPTPQGPKPVAKGIVSVYNAAKTTGDG